MILNNGIIKCDVCGKFISVKDNYIFYQSDSYYTVERIEDHCKKCKEDEFNKSNR